MSPDCKYPSRVKTRILQSPNRLGCSPLKSVGALEYSRMIPGLAQSAGRVDAYVHITMQVKMTKNRAARFIVFPPPVTSHKHHIMAELWYFMPFSFCS